MRFTTRCKYLNHDSNWCYVWLEEALKLTSNLLPVICIFPRGHLFLLFQVHWHFTQGSSKVCAVLRTSWHGSGQKILIFFSCLFQCWKLTQIRADPNWRMCWERNILLRSIRKRHLCCSITTAPQWGPSHHWEKGGGGEWLGRYSDSKCNNKSESVWRWKILFRLSRRI